MNFFTNAKLIIFWWSIKCNTWDSHVHQLRLKVTKVYCKFYDQFYVLGFFSVFRAIKDPVTRVQINTDSKFHWRNIHSSFAQFISKFSLPMAYTQKMCPEEEWVQQRTHSRGNSVCPCENNFPFWQRSERAGEQIPQPVLSLQVQLWMGLMWQRLQINNGK